MYDTSGCLTRCFVFLVPRDFILQGNLFDAKWHSITLTQKSNIISVTVDNKNSQNLTVDSEKGDQSGEKDDPVYFGGLELPKFTFEVKSKKNYKGCLQQLQYNKVCDPCLAGPSNPSGNCPKY